MEAVWENREMRNTRTENPSKPAVAPRRSLEHKLLNSTVALVAISTFICATWLNHMASRAMRENHQRNVAMIGQTLASTMADRMDGDTRAQTLRRMLDMHIDQRLAFLVLVGPDEEMLHQRTIDIASWNEYKNWIEAHADAGSIHNDKPIALGRHGELVVQRVPIWNPPITPRRLDTVTPVSRELQGFVILALRERRMGQMVAELWAMQIVAAALICLVSVPIVAWGARRWTRPVRDLLAATTQLSEGEAPQPIDAHADDDLGALAASFNRMASNLYNTQSQLKTANEDLEAKVQQRTAELRQLTERLQNELRDKDDFLRTVTHDLSAPLRNINGMTSMLLIKYESELNEDTVNKLHRISANVKVQSELINDLMELSRIRTRSGKREAVDMNQIATRLAEAMSYDLETAGIDLRIDDGLPVVYAERNRMRQLLQNLLDNAIKYMGDAPKRQIHIGFARRGDELHFQVTDTGPGIDEKDLPKLFHVFKRGIYGKHKVPGRGVGLASVKTIVECYGGKVWAESRKGQGATFHFTLDALQVAVPAGDVPQRFERKIASKVRM
jgi:signal transduction histidine kinase